MFGSLLLSLLPAYVGPQEPTWRGDIAAEWVAKIGEVQESELFESFRELGAAASIPALTEFILEAEPARAWVAVRALDRLEPSGSTALIARNAARSLAKGLKPEGESRTLAALALGALGSHAEARSKTLAKLLEAELPRERLAAALALARIGGEAYESLLEAAEAADPVAAALGCGALASMGPKAEPATRGLVKLVADRKSGRVLLLMRSLLFALGAIDDEERERALEERKAAEGKRQVWNRGKVNWGGTIAWEFETLVVLLEVRHGIEVRPIGDYELPRRFKWPLRGEHIYLLDGVGQALAHLTEGVPGLVRALEADEFPTWEALSARTERWVHTTELLIVWGSMFPDD